MRRLALALALVGAVSCGGSSDGDTSEGTDAPAAQATAAPTPAPGTAAPGTVTADTGMVDTAAPASTAADVPVPEALAFRAPLVGGGELDAATYAGRPVAFWFWAPY